MRPQLPSLARTTCLWPVANGSDGLSHAEIDHGWKQHSRHLAPRTQGEVRVESARWVRADIDPVGRHAILRVHAALASLAFEALGAEQAAVDSDVGAFDRDGADGLGVVVGWAHAADDRVAVAGVLHVLEAGEQ